VAEITAYRHGDRWAVAERGANSPVKEFPSREAAELAANQMSAGGSVEVREHDPTGLEHTEPQDAGEPDRSESTSGGVDASEGVRWQQPGL